MGQIFAKCEQSLLLDDLALAYPKIATGIKDKKSAFDQNLSLIPVRVDVINVEGLFRTRDDYVVRNIRNLFKVTNFEELISTVTEAQKQLEKLGCFRRVGIAIDTNKGPEASPNGYQVTFITTEVGRFAGSVNTELGANDGSLLFALKMPNLLGRGDKLSLEHTYGSREARNSNLTYSKPILGPWNTKISTGLVHQMFKNKLLNYNLKNTGGLITWEFQPAEEIRHILQWEGGWRTLETNARSTSMGIREQCGDSFKSVLRHVLSIDYRDATIFPTDGMRFKLAHEFSGLGGDVYYLKHESDIQANIPLPFDLVLQGGFRLGVLKSLPLQIQGHCAHDLFFLGGPCGTHALRGFEMKSIGSKGGKDFLGGQAYWSAAAHLYGPLPFNLGAGSFGDYFRTHAFINAGNITDESFKSRGFGENVHSLLWNFRAACGIGIAFGFGQMARVEVNYCWPLKFTDGDKKVKGIQLGMGLEFL